MPMHKKRDRAIHEPNKDVTMRIQGDVLGNVMVQDIQILGGW